MVIGDRHEDVSQRANFNRIVVWHCQVMFAVLLGRQPNMRTLLRVIAYPSFSSDFASPAPEMSRGSFTASTLPHVRNASE